MGDQTSLARPVRTPAHLRRFHPPSLTIDIPSTTSTVPLIHPSLQKAIPSLGSSERTLPYRKPRTRSRKDSVCSTLRSILLKEWPHSADVGRRGPSLDKTAIMRMKDSEDYITARAANPYTGLISPSIPDTPRTPETPAAALELGSNGLYPTSSNNPTILIIPSRPVLQRANEGRKISGSNPGLKFKPDLPTIISTNLNSKPNGPRNPPPRTVEHHSTILPSSSPPAAAPKMNKKAPPMFFGLGEADMNDPTDRFIIPMPSAQEPQPYAFPGCSSRQIAAFQHYRTKARKTSAEGYDTRLISPPSSSSAARAAAATRTAARNKGEAWERMPGAFYTTGRAFSTGTVVVLDEAEEDTKTEESPKVVRNGERLKTKKSPPPPLNLNGPVEYQYVDSAGIDEHYDLDDLSSLPAIRILHPRLAGLPVEHPLRSLIREEDERRLSPGTKRQRLHGVSGGGELYVKKRRPRTSSTYDEDTLASPSKSTITTPTTPTSASKASSSPTNLNPSLQPLKQTLTAATSALLSSLAVLSTTMPSSKNILSAAKPSESQLSGFQILASQSASAEQKAAALKQLSGVAGRILLLCLVLGMLWEVYCGVVRAVGWVLWPVRVLLGVVGWVFGVG